MQPLYDVYKTLGGKAERPSIRDSEILKLITVVNAVLVHHGDGLSTKPPGF